ncbi:MAG: hypothetical protein WD772_12760 [Pseudohongiellaceae bacterium]
MLRAMIFLALLVPASGFAQLVDNSPVKFAFYSSAWGENAVAGMRVVAENQQDFPILLLSITFTTDSNGQLVIPLEIAVPARGYAEKELPYVDLLSDDACVTDTMSEDWRLVEISNYTLNPSVRSLIIEDTSAFRIYQCVRKVATSWSDDSGSEPRLYEEWVLYHFERRLGR